MDRTEIIDRFRYRPPLSTARSSAHETARNLVCDIALALDGIVPDCREKSIVLTKLEEALFWANAAIARQPA